MRILRQNEGSHPSRPSGAKSGSLFHANIAVETAGSDADLTTLLAGIAPLLGFRWCPIRVYHPLLRCPLLVLGRLRLPVWLRVVAG
jgi:hypothetical protein